MPLIRLNNKILRVNNSVGELFTSDPGIITTNLIQYLDAGNPLSYPGSGDSWFDLSGYNNHGTLDGASFTSEHGGGIVFSPNDYVACGDDTSLSIVEELSISFVTKFTPVFRHFVMGRGTAGGSGREFSIDIITNTMRFWNRNTAATFSYTFTGDLVYVTLVRTGPPYRTVSLYVNGVFQQSLVTSGDPEQDVTLNTTWGRLGDYAAALYYTGTIYQTLIYNKALIQSEITQNFDVVKGRFGL